jgi:hypothetical protein
MPFWAVRYKLEPLCQLPKTRFEAKVLFGDILSFLVCRQNVAKTATLPRELSGGLKIKRGDF